MRLTFLLSGVFVLILGTANYFVDAFRGYGIVYMDIYAVRTAANVAGEYKYHGSPQLWLGLSLGLLCLVLCVVGDTGAFAKVQPSERDCRCRGNGCRRGFFRVDQSGNGFFCDVSNLTWDHSIGMSEYGYLLYVTANAGQAKVQVPDGYSPEKADEILSRYKDASSTNSVLATHAGFC